MQQFATYYQDVLDMTPKKSRDYLRSIALDLLYIKNKWNSDRQLGRPRVQMLYFHHIFKDEENKFDKLLNKLSKSHTFISYSEAVERIVTNKIDKAYISFSSDDGFKNNIKAAKILNNYDASCCFFVNTDLIDENRFEVLKKHCNEKLVFPATEMLTWKEVEQLQRWKHEIGSHTLNHMNVAISEEEEIRQDMRKTFEVLKARCGEAKHFAYPYGRFFHFNELGRKAVFDAGFISCATAERGCHINGNATIDFTKLALRRDQVIVDWKWQHIYYFLINNSKNINLSNSYFSY